MSDKHFSHFCPQCSSAMISTVLLSEQAVCRACDWEGSTKELLAMPLGQGVNPEELIKQLFQELANTFAQVYAPTFGKVLFEWGFLDQANMTQELALYVKSAAGAMVSSVLRTREHLEGMRKEQAISHVQEKGFHDA